MSEKDYDELAYTRTIYRQLQRYLSESFTETDTPAKQELICEDVKYSRRVVPQASIQEALRLLEGQELECVNGMARFELRRIDDQPKEESPVGGKPPSGSSRNIATPETRDVPRKDQETPQGRKARRSGQVAKDHSTG